MSRVLVIDDHEQLRTHLVTLVGPVGALIFRVGFVMIVLLGLDLVTVSHWFR